MPQWLLPNKEGYISFMASKDLYKKFLVLAICAVYRAKRGKRRGNLNFYHYINGKITPGGIGRFCPSNSDHVQISYLEIENLWGVDPFGPNDFSSFQFGVRASGGTIVKKCGFRLLCKPLEDDWETLCQDDQLLDPALLYEIWHDNKEMTTEEESWAHLSLQRWLNHEDNGKWSEEDDESEIEEEDRESESESEIEEEDRESKIEEEDRESESEIEEEDRESEIEEEDRESESEIEEEDRESESESEEEDRESIEEDDATRDVSKPADIMADFPVEKYRYSGIRTSYKTIIPGGDMPEEFVYVEGSTISFMVSQDFYDKFLGLVLCVVFNVEDGEKEIFFDIVPHINGQRRNVLSGTLGSFGSGHIWIQYLKPNVLWGMLEGAVDFLEFDEDYLRFSLTLIVSGGTMEKLGYVLRCKQLDDELKAVLEDNQLVDPASLCELEYREFLRKFLRRSNGGTGGI